MSCRYSICTKRDGNQLFFSIDIRFTVLPLSFFEFISFRGRLAGGRARRGEERRGEERSTILVPLFPISLLSLEIMRIENERRKKNPSYHFKRTLGEEPKGKVMTVESTPRHQKHTQGKIHKREANLPSLSPSPFLSLSPSPMTQAFSFA